MADEVKVGPVTADEIAAMLTCHFGGSGVYAQRLATAAIAALVAERHAALAAAPGTAPLSEAEKVHGRMVAERIAARDPQYLCPLLDSPGMGAQTMKLSLLERDLVRKLLEAARQLHEGYCAAECDCGYREVERDVRDMLEPPEDAPGTEAPPLCCCRCGREAPHDPRAALAARCVCPDCAQVEAPRGEVRETKVQTLVMVAEELWPTISADGSTPCERHIEPCGECLRCRFRAALDALKKAP